MSAWRRKALQVIPELRVIIESSNNVTYLWCELESVFSDCFEKENNELLHKILKYAEWCVSEESGDSSGETAQAVYCGFLETITYNRKYYPSFKEWFSPAQFEKYKGSFMYALDDKQYKFLEGLYYGR